MTAYIVELNRLRTELVAAIEAKNHALANALRYEIKMHGKNSDRSK